MHPVRTALVGFGWWGRKMATLLLDHPDSLALVAIVEPVLDMARDFAAAHGLRLEARLETVLADLSLEAVILATPHALHEAQIEAAVAAGKHMFCEKPLSLTRSGAERAVRLCEEAGLVLGMGHERRFEPPMAELLRHAVDGRLGRLLQIEANFSHDKFLGLDPSNWRLHP
ncbi:MAG: Gfo/Idh/MocA family protein, partial [Janthinobacterium lividum]